MTGKDTGKRRGRMRPLSEEERELWQHVTRDASPLTRRASEPVAEQKKTPEKISHTSAPFMLERRVSAQPTATPRAITMRIPPPFTGIDRRTSQRLGRGQIEFDAKLDLHGHTRENAYVALRRFLTDARRAGLRCVLIVTGKGENPFARHTLHGAQHYDAPERLGVLRSALPHWLEEPELRALVSGFQPAHPKHGGGGAFYVLLRRRR